MFEVVLSFGSEKLDFSVAFIFILWFVFLINGLTLKSCKEMYTTNLKIVAFSVIKLWYKLA